MDFLDVATLAAETLLSGREILVVGVTPGNLGSWHHHEDRRLHFWDTTGPKSTSRTPPQATGLVLLTRFNNHDATRRLRSLLPASAVVYSKHLNTGELKVVLEQAIKQVPLCPRKDTTTVLVAPVIPQANQTPVVVNPVLPIAAIVAAEVEAPSMPPQEEVVRKEVMEVVKKVTAPRGNLKAFVAKNAQFDTPIGKESLRLFELAASEGLPTTPGSIAQAMRIVKRAANTNTATPGTPVAPPSTKASSAPRKQRADSVKVLQEFVRLADLVAIAVADILEESKSLQDENRRMKEEKAATRKAMKDALAKL